MDTFFLWLNTRVADSLRRCIASDRLTVKGGRKSQRGRDLGGTGNGGFCDLIPHPKGDSTGVSGKSLTSKRHDRRP